MFPDGAMPNPSLAPKKHLQFESSNNFNTRHIYNETLSLQSLQPFTSFTLELFLLSSSYWYHYFCVPAHCFVAKSLIPISQDAPPILLDLSALPI